MSAIRQNFHEECEAAINKQINMELYASYVYLSMAYHFNRDDVALEGYFNFFKNQSDEERDHAQKLMEYQNKRGGRIVLHGVTAPPSEWSTPISALEDALELEKKVNESLLALNSVSTKHDDPHLSDYITSHFLTEQVESASEISKLVTNAKRCGDGLGTYIFDKQTMSSMK